MDKNEVQYWLDRYEKLTPVEKTNLIGIAFKSPDLPLSEIDWGTLVRETNSEPSNYWLSQNFDSLLTVFCHWRSSHPGAVTFKGVVAFVPMSGSLLASASTGFVVGVLCLLVDVGADKICPYHKVFVTGGSGNYSCTPDDVATMALVPTECEAVIKYHPGTELVRVNKNYPSPSHWLDTGRPRMFEARITFPTDLVLTKHVSILREDSCHELSVTDGAGRLVSFSSINGTSCGAEQTDPVTLRIVGNCEALLIDGEGVPRLVI